MNDGPSRMESLESYPAFYSFIRMRRESFGILLFNPYLASEMELNHPETLLAEKLDGTNTLADLRNHLASKCSLSPEAASQLLGDTMTKLEQLHAVRFLRERNERRPQIGNAVDVSSNLCLSAPKSVIWDLTYACNFWCKHCLNSSGKAEADELDTRQAIQLIDSLHESGIFYLSLTGGEPFLRPDFLTLLRRISDVAMHVDIATNGFSIPEEILNGMRELRVFDVQVSIDGIGEYHDRFRGRIGAFSAACKTIERLLDSEISVSISTTVTAENISSLDAIIDFAFSSGCKSFKAIPFLPAGRGKRNKAKLQLLPAQHRLLSETLLRKRKELWGKMSVGIDTTMHYLLEPVDTPRAGGQPFSSRMGCSAGNSTLHIGADGTAYPCPFLHDFPLGNLTQVPLLQIWHESALLDFFRGLQRKHIEGPCAECSLASIVCNGGCRAAAYLEHGSLQAMDPACFFEWR